MGTLYIAYTSYLIVSLYIIYIAREGVMMKKAKLGSGARFKSLEKKLSKQGVSDPQALAASIGMKKYGKKKMETLAKKGKK